MGLNSIRRIYDHTTEYNIVALEQCRAILLSQFPYMSEKEADELLDDAGEHAVKPYRSVVIIAEGRDKQVLGVAIASHFMKDNFIFLDFIATNKHRISGGIGGALYERLRDEAHSLSAIGVFFDCLTDKREWAVDAGEYRQNLARLKFYEKYGARPLEGFNYDLRRDDISYFYLVFDGLGKKDHLSAQLCKSIVSAILENKAKGKVSDAYIGQVLRSIKGVVTLRPFKYVKSEPIESARVSIPNDKQIALVINQGHLIHHVRERGYLESPVRVTTILKELNKTAIFRDVSARQYPDSHIEAVHDKQYLKFLKKICEWIGETSTMYGDVFPIRNAARLPKDIELQIGYYCIDTSTPLNANAYKAARAAVNCALTAADVVLGGQPMAYALVRPPGHHAERKYFGGFCYLNSNAVAAHYLSKKDKKVVILDIDYHHGNGQQDIFYHRSDVFTVSIHGDPEYAYPNFTGFTDEIGEGEGEGFNLNIALPKGVEGLAYHKALKKALEAIKKYKPDYLVIALGLDIAKGDPSGTWLLSPDDFAINGKMIASLKLPTLVIQEGGYKNKVLGLNARRFFQGLWEGYYLNEG
jgi:acetoin utilization deacetylase AcuC-like enzyme